MKKEMNMRVILIALTAVMLSTVSYAQKVITVGGAVIIDCSEMSPKFYTSVPKSLITKATVDGLGPNDLTNLSSTASNELVYKKFEVHKTDNSATGLKWEPAMKICPSLNSNGTGWRLPTQRESMLIFILYEKLVANGLTAFSKAGGYMTATTKADSHSQIWIIDFNYSRIIDVRKDDSGGRVCCIRDIIDK